MLFRTYQKRFRASPVQAEQGELLIRQGNNAGGTILLKCRRLIVELKNEGDPARQITTVKPSEIVGEMALFGDNHYSARVRVEERLALPSFYYVIVLQS